MPSNAWRHSAAAATAVAALVAPLALLAGPASAAEPSTVVINEVDIDADWIEFVNTGTEAVDISGYLVRDDQDDHTFTVPADTVVAPGEFWVADVNADELGDAGFGLGKADAARFFAPDGTSIAEYSWASEPLTSYGRCADGTGDFIVTGGSSKGAANICSADAADAVVINEVESQNGEPGDWVELVNTALVPADISGLQFKDADDAHLWSVPAGTSIAAGGYVVFDEADFGFGLGSGDSARLFTADGAAVIDEYSWTEHATTTWGRCPDGLGDFALTASPTKGAANDCAPAAAAGSVVINEVESNADTVDWVEFMNIGGTAVDLSGYHFRDNDDSRPDVLPAGSILQPGELFVFEQQSATNPDGFDFGLGNPDEVRLSDTQDVPVASYAWEAHAQVTFARCPDGTGEFVDVITSTKGAPNDCSSALRINEVESNGGTPGDWIELINIGSEPIDASGYVLRDDDDTHAYVLPAGLIVAAGGYLVLDELTDTTPGFDFGFGGGDTARLFASDGVELLSSYSWTAHAATTYGRCPDGTGEFTTTVASTKGAVNACEGIITSTPWPGGADLVPVDAADTFTGDLSGLDYEPSGSSELGTLWAVENGNGLLYRLLSNGDGGWMPDTADGWSSGKTLHYPGGAGQVDAEGVTIVGDDSSGGVYVAGERDDAASSISRPSVLRYDVSGSATELTPSHEWNLATDFPGLGANAGLEGVTWIPDAYLTENGFVDQRSGAAYDPADYPGHSGGLFLIGVEGTASVYAYALMTDGSFERVAEIGTPFAVVADVQFDADLGALWVICDDACDGRTALYEIAADGTDAGAFVPTDVFERPAGAAAELANEGFAVADDAVCVDGVKPTFYADDSDTDGYSLRQGTIGCEIEGATPTDPETPADSDEEPSDGEQGPNTDTDTAGSDAGTGSGTATGSGTNADEIASTGVDLLAGVIIALLLLAAGGGIAIVRRRATV